MYQHGLGKKKDIVKAVELYDKAVELDNNYAKYNLSLMTDNYVIRHMLSMDCANSLKSGLMHKYVKTLTPLGLWSDMMIRIITVRRKRILFSQLEFIFFNIDTRAFVPEYFFCILSLAIMFNRSKYFDSLFEIVYVIFRSVDFFVQTHIVQQWFCVNLISVIILSRL